MLGMKRFRDEQFPFLTLDLCGYSKIKFFAIYRNFSLLSFGDEAEEDEEEIAVVSKVRRMSPQH